MWKPDAVVPEHRWRARIVWAGLLLSIAAYTIWQIWKIFDGYKNITTSLEVSNEVYEFPYLTVCFHPGQGCGDEDTDCAASALENAAVSDFTEQYQVASESHLDGCIGYDLASLNVEAKDVAPEDLALLVSTTWVLSGTASTDTDFFNHVTIFTSGGEPTEDNVSYMFAPYTRLTPSSDVLVTHAVAEVTIGKTTNEALDGTKKTTFPPLVQSTSDYVTDNPLPATADDEIAYGVLLILMRQGAFSDTFVKEISPLDLGDFFGNIGGFWELLIIFWGLLFIATREERAPKLKARDFVKTVQTGKDILRRRSLSVDSGSSPSSTGEERAHWESAFQGTNAAAAVPPGLPPRGGDTNARGGTAVAAVFPAMAPVSGSTNGSSTATRRASTASSSSGSSSGNGNHRQETGASSTPPGNGFSSFGRYKRPVVQDMPRRGSRAGRRPPEGQAPAPPSYAAMSAV